jgi:GTPase SAR1 family protein
LPLDAHAVVLAFSSTDRASFEMVKGWKSKLESVLSLSDIVMVLVQNKMDLPAVIEP